MKGTPVLQPDDLNEAQLATINTVLNTLSYIFLDRPMPDARKQVYIEALCDAQKFQTYDELHNTLEIAMYTCREFPLPFDLLEL